MTISMSFSSYIISSTVATVSLIEAHFLGLICKTEVIACYKACGKFGSAKRPNFPVGNTLG